jgi:hypothetical protein
MRKLLEIPPMETMRREGIGAALTHDGQFTQDRFSILL